MPRTVRQAVEAHKRLIMFYSPEKGWSQTTVEGDEYGRNGWHPTLAAALGSDVVATPEEDEAIAFAIKVIPLGRFVHYKPNDPAEPNLTRCGGLHPDGEPYDPAWTDIEAADYRVAAFEWVSRDFWPEMYGNGWHRGCPLW